MLNVVRRSQIQGLVAMDSSTVSHLGEIEAVWLDETGKVTYLSSSVGYIPLEQVADITNDVLSTYGRLVIDAPENVSHLDRKQVQSVTRMPLGWVEDFLFDWHTGEVAAYILTGKIAETFGECAVLAPDDVEEITLEGLILREGAEKRLKPRSKGLEGFLSEKSQQVQHLVKVMGSHLHHLIHPHDQPEIVQVRINEVMDELATLDEPDHNALQEAIAYLHEHWQSLQQSISRSENRAKSALASAWRHLTAKH